MTKTDWSAWVAYDNDDIPEDGTGGTAVFSNEVAALRWANRRYAEYRVIRLLDGETISDAIAREDEAVSDV